MKKFQFRLEPLRRYRQHLTESAKAGLLRSLRQRALLEKSLELQRRSLSEAHQEIHAKPQLTAEDLRLYSNYLQSSRGQLNRLEQEIRAIEKQIQEQRRQFHSRKQDGEALERLRKRRLSEHQQEAGRAEQSAADDLHLTRLRRKTAE